MAARPLISSLKRPAVDIARQASLRTAVRWYTPGSLRINSERMMKTLHETCEWGSTHRYGPGDYETGMARLTLDENDATARRWLSDEAQKLGCTVTTDEMGNMFLIRPGKSSGHPTAMGSHLDTQPTGGRYDGILGIMAGLEALRTLNDNNIQTEYPVALGILRLSPGSVNTAPGHVFFTLDIRHPCTDKLASLCSAIESAAHRIASQDSEKGCELEWVETFNSPAITFDPDCIASVRKAVEVNYGAEQGKDIYSGAGHDTCSTSKRCPSSMIFITSKDGDSHNPREHSSPEDCEPPLELYSFQASNPKMTTPSTPTGVDASSFTEFDYVVVGGGTAGLTVAARLSEDPSITVGVIEAGLWRPDDPKINYPAFIGQSLMNPDYDWCLETEPEQHSNGRKYIWPRGKVLGGSSALNFLVWQRGYKGEYDDIGKLGNQGWSWDDFAKFARKSATLEKPSTELQKANLATCDDELHGKDGPVKTSYSKWYTEAQKPYVRSYSANAHYAPNAGRQNLKVITGAHASKILFDPSSAGGELVATGVELIVDGKSYKVKAKKEVVVSGGTVHSPHLLELSGIGKAEVLKAAGIEQRLELDVGENVQDHIYCTSSFKLKPGFITWDKMRQDDFAKAAMEQYHGEGEDRGIIASAFSGFAYVPLSQYLSGEEISKIKSEVSNVDWSKYSKGVQETVKMQLARLDDEKCPFTEFIFAPGFFATASPPADNQEYYSIIACLQQPFSRGNIHLSSSDPTKPPKIQANYFSIDADLEILSKAVKYCETIADTSPLKEITVARQDPDPSKYTSDDDFREFTKDQSVTEYHPIGSCSMMPREKGGVVDARLKVYGTKNVRVADASVIPIHVSLHIVQTVYAIGEKAAHMIKEDAGKV
ncbi:hypothetical protein NDA16_001777 [Ustilago loliicola]|nr:hypothetical protein NDA16_001777 [Ustilago loliicola]